MKPFNVEVPVIPLNAPKEGDGSGWSPLNPRTETLPKGWKGARSEGIKDDILIEHDVAITVRDGAKLYADVYRPAMLQQETLLHSSAGVLSAKSSTAFLPSSS